MRIITFIMAFLVLALSCVPCADGSEQEMTLKVSNALAQASTATASDEHQTGNSDQTGDRQKNNDKHNTGDKQNASDEQNDEHDDNCSPFCHCSCCAGFSINHQVATLQQPWPHTGGAHSTRYVVSISEAHIPVWQPPQLS